jgi:site-specific recombinase XerD
MTIMYEHPPVDNVASTYYVDTPDATENLSKDVETVEEAIEVYLRAFHEKFQSPAGRRQRRICLRYFQRYLVSQGHAMKLKELTITDGQGFIDSLVNHYNGLPLKPSEIKKYRSAIRSFSRFLHQTGIIEKNIFLAIKKNSR